MLLLWSVLSFLFLFWIVHRCNLNLIYFQRFLFDIQCLIFFCNFLLPCFKNRSLRRKVYWGLIIILIHLRNVEGNKFSGRVSLILNERSFIKIIGTIRNLIFSCNVVFRFHLLNILRECHSFFKVSFGISFKIIVHFTIIKYIQWVKY